MNSLSIPIFLLFFLGLLSACSVGSLSSFTVKGSTSATLPESLEDLFDIQPSIVSLQDSRALGTPSSVSVPIFVFYVSLQPDCSNPERVIDYGNIALTKDFSTGPTLFSGNPNQGSYECAIIVVGDVIEFGLEGAGDLTFCEVLPTLNQFDVYQDTVADSDQWVDIEGDSIPARGTGSNSIQDVVTFYATTDSNAVIGARGVKSEQVLPLSRAFAVPGEVTFYADFSNRVTDSSGTCGLTLSGSFGFR